MEGEIMPLQDHFRPPLGVRRHWHSFHSGWAHNIAADLNSRLPEGYFAEPNMRYGIQIDAARLTGPHRSPRSITTSIITDVVQVKVFSHEENLTVVGEIELLSPLNKVRPANHDAFIAWCAGRLQQGLGLVVVDVVSNLHFDWHGELLKRLGSTEENRLNADLSTAAYRPVERDTQPSLDIWQQRLEVGSPLLTMPLWLPGNLCLPVDLYSTYNRTCREHRITA
jgi:hypothetical protein